MKNSFFGIGLLVAVLGGIFFFSGIGIQTEVQEVQNVQEVKSDSNPLIVVSKDIELQRIVDEVWVHTSYMDYKGVRTPSNGLVIVTSEGMLLIDTPWNDEQTKTLIEAAEDNFKQPFIKAVLTHAHSDRMGGINELIKNDIETYSTSLTAELAEKIGVQRPSKNIESDGVMSLGHLNFHVFYPGEGHSKDNIVIWMPEKEILFAGCLVKDVAATTIGNTTDANLQQWGRSLDNLIKKYEGAKIVIPGHGKWGDTELIKHTMQLINAN